MKKVKNKKKFYKLSLITSICFILTYLATKITLNLILALIWAFIGISYFLIYLKEKA